MRPPICEYCDNDFRHNVEGEGGLVYFAKDEKDADWYRRAEQPGFVGHPPHLGWFCAAHYPAAKALSHLTFRQALTQLRQQFDPPK